MSDNSKFEFWKLTSNECIYITKNVQTMKNDLLHPCNRKLVIEFAILYRFFCMNVHYTNSEFRNSISYSVLNKYPIEITRAENNHIIDETNKLYNRNYVKDLFIKFVIF